MKKLISKVATALSKVITIKNNKLIFESGRGRADDNPRYFYDYLKVNRPEYNLKYLIYKTTDHDGLDPKDIVYYNTLKYFYHISSSHLLVKSNSVASVISKKKKQKYIQLWHGGEFKNCDHVPGTEFPKKHIADWDIFISNNKMQNKMIQKQTGYSKEIFTLGMIRTDYLNANKLKPIKMFKENINLSPDRRTILYAPTFRDSDLALDEKDLASKINTVIRKVANALNSDDVLLLRLHPLLKAVVIDEVNQTNIIDVSHVEKVEDLLLASDILITDYSSIIYDYAILERPIIFFTYDNDEYISYRGDHYLSLDKDIPGECAIDAEELKNKISAISSKFDYKYIRSFNERFNHYNDGGVGDRLVLVIDNLIVADTQ